MLSSPSTTQPYSTSNDGTVESSLADSLHRSEVDIRENLNCSQENALSDSDMKLPSSQALPSSTNKSHKTALTLASPQTQISLSMKETQIVKALSELETRMEMEALARSRITSESDIKERDANMEAISLEMASLTDSYREVLLALHSSTTRHTTEGSDNADQQEHEYLEEKVDSGRDVGDYADDNIEGAICFQSNSMECIPDASESTTSLDSTNLNLTSQSKASPISTATSANSQSNSWGIWDHTEGSITVILPSSVLNDISTSSIPVSSSADPSFDNSREIFQDTEQGTDEDDGVLAEQMEILANELTDSSHRREVLEQHLADLKAKLQIMENEKKQCQMERDQVVAELESERRDRQVCQAKEQERVRLEREREGRNWDLQRDRWARDTRRKRTMLAKATTRLKEFVRKVLLEHPPSPKRNHVNRRREQEASAQSKRKRVTWEDASTNESDTSDSDSMESGSDTETESESDDVDDFDSAAYEDEMELTKGVDEVLLWGATTVSELRDQLKTHEKQELEVCDRLGVVVNRLESTENELKVVLSQSEMHKLGEAAALAEVSLLQTSIAALEKQTEAQSIQCKHLQDQVDLFEPQVVTLKSELLAKQAMIKEFELQVQKSNQISVCLSNVEASNSELQSKLDVLEKNLVPSLQGKIAANEECSNSILSQLQESESKVSRLELELSDARNLLESQTSHVATLQSQNNQLENKTLPTLRSDVSYKGQRIQELEEQVQSLQLTIETMGTAQTANEDLQARLSSLENKTLPQLRQQLDTARAREIELESESSLLKKTVETLRSEKSAAEEQLDALRSQEVPTLQQGLQTAVNRVQDLEIEVQWLTEGMENMRQEHAETMKEAFARLTDQLYSLHTESVEKLKVEHAAEMNQLEIAIAHSEQMHANRMRMVKQLVRELRASTTETAVAIRAAVDSITEAAVLCVDEATANSRRLLGVKHEQAEREMIATCDEWKAQVEALSAELQALRETHQQCEAQKLAALEELQRESLDALQSQAETLHLQAIRTQKFLEEELERLRHAHASCESDKKAALQAANAKSLKTLQMLVDSARAECLKERNEELENVRRECTKNANIEAETALSEAKKAHQSELHEALKLLEQEYLDKTKAQVDAAIQKCADEQAAALDALRREMAQAVDEAVETERNRLSALHQQEISGWESLVETFERRVEQSEQLFQTLEQAEEGFQAERELLWREIRELQNVDD